VGVNMNTSELITVTGTVSKITYDSASQQVIRVKARQGLLQVVINDKHLLVEYNDHIRVAGIKCIYELYGEQILAKEVDVVPITNELMVDFLSSGQGVGKQIAERMVSAFGSELLDTIINNDISALASVDRVSLALAKVICNNFNRVGGKVELLNWLNNLLLSVRAKDKAKFNIIAKNAYVFYGKDTVAKLKEDPYRIWAFSTWNDAELFARILDVSLDDRRRLVCALEEVLFKALGNGSTQLPLKDIEQGLISLVGEKMVNKALYVALDLAHSDSFRFSVVETSDGATSTLERLLSRRIALPAAKRMEDYVKEQLIALNKRNLLPVIITAAELDNYILDGGHVLSGEQKHAVQMVLSNSLSAVSGGAGTGKTSLLQCVTDIIESSGSDILQVALSGKAAQRLQSQTKKAAMTIESLLLRVENNPKFLDKYGLPLLLIDEASMVDLQSMYRVLKVFEGRSVRVVFVGDWAQLSPVGVGLIYHKIMQSNVVNTVELTKNFRSATDIASASKRIREGSNIANSRNVKVIQCRDYEELLRVAKRQYELCLSADSLHIVAATRRTVSELNRELHRTLMKNRRVISCAPQFRVGDKVIYKKNALENLGIVNGSTGVVIDGSDTEVIVEFEREGQVRISKDFIQSRSEGEYYLLHAYALTCHSAQGSEFDVAIVVVENSSLVEQSWLYTALTRAKKRVILVEVGQSIQNALARGFRFESIHVGFEI